MAVGAFFRGARRIHMSVRARMMLMLLLLLLLLLLMLIMSLFGQLGLWIPSSGV